jgi:hypothetical protein
VSVVVESGRMTASRGESARLWMGGCLYQGILVADGGCEPDRWRKETSR